VLERGKYPHAYRQESVARGDCSEAGKHWVIACKRHDELRLTVNTSEHTKKGHRSGPGCTVLLRCFLLYSFELGQTRKPP
jgi:hypothetical protein